MITEEVKKQWQLPISEFELKVKCCYNCPNWCKDPTLMHEYVFNVCKKQKTVMTAWDYICDEYCGLAKEEKLIASLTPEETKALKEEFGE